MYRIKQSDTTIATVDRLQFWRMQRNGIRINCIEGDANGIIVNDAFYHLPWMPESGAGEPDVTYEEFNGAAAVAEYDAALTDIADALGVSFE